MEIVVTGLKNKDKKIPVIKIIRECRTDGKDGLRDVVNEVNALIEVGTPIEFSIYDEGKKAYWNDYASQHVEWGIVSESHDERVLREAVINIREKAKKVGNIAVKVLEEDVEGAEEMVTSIVTAAMFAAISKRICDYLDISVDDALKMMH